MFFKQFSSIGGLGATMADFGTRGSVFKSWLHLFFFLVKISVYWNSNPGPSNPKSAMLTLRPPILKFCCEKNFECTFA